MSNHIHEYNKWNSQKVGENTTHNPQPQARQHPKSMEHSNLRFVSFIIAVKLRKNPFHLLKQGVIESEKIQDWVGGKMRRENATRYLITILLSRYHCPSWVCTGQNPTQTLLIMVAAQLSAYDAHEHHLVTFLVSRYHCPLWVCTSWSPNQKLVLVAAAHLSADNVHAAHLVTFLVSRHHCPSGVCTS